MSEETDLVHLGVLCKTLILVDYLLASNVRLIMNITMQTKSTKFL